MTAFADFLFLPGIPLPFHGHFFACLNGSNCRARILSSFPEGGDIMLRKLQEFLSGLGSASVQQPQFDGQMLDRKREDVYALMHEQMISLR